MQKFITLLISLILSTALLTSCTNNNEEYTPKTYTLEGSKVTSISLDVQDREIEVKPSKDSQVHIDYFENTKEYYDINLSDDQKLTMVSVERKEIKDYIGLNSAQSSSKILLQVPNNILTSLQVSTTNKDISLSDLTVLGDISLDNQGGDIVFDKINAEKSINLKGKNGNITGSIIGNYDDYTISSNIKKGQSNLPTTKNQGAKYLNLTNNNGDVNIEFVP